MCQNSDFHFLNWEIFAYLYRFKDAHFVLNEPDSLTIQIDFLSVWPKKENILKLEV